MLVHDCRRQCGSIWAPRPQQNMPGLSGIRQGSDVGGRAWAVCSCLEFQTDYYSGLGNLVQGKKLLGRSE